MIYSKEYIKEIIEMFQLFINDETRLLSYTLGLKIIEKYYINVVSRNLIKNKDDRMFFNISQKTITFHREYNAYYSNIYNTYDVFYFEIPYLMEVEKEYVKNIIEYLKQLNN